MIYSRLLFRLPVKHITRTALTLILLCACASLNRPLRAQEDPGDVLRVETNLVQLNVGVVDRQGRAVTNLSRNDFIVYEDEVRQPIVNFEPTATPFSLVLLLDMSGSTLNFRGTLKQAALRFIDALGPADRVAVVAFNTKVETLAKFTVDRRKIAEAISYAEGKGDTHFYQALRRSLEELAKEGQRRKAIVVLSDGLDTEMRALDRASAWNARTNEEAVASIKPEASASLNEVLNAADRQGVTIYPLALPSGDPQRLAFPDPKQIAIYTSARTRMQALADRTGGRLNAIRRLEDLGFLYAEVAADLRTLYSVGYQPSGPRARDGRWRKIRIEVARPELIARTRPGYYAH
ncbi:MAG TPA: VWA domain-containing protein [Pyrinomonadaceae bacterium]|jgi:VWFA-related protein|nr:VWA domain-containing protein [Pyrinomonadaceae bacterium]